MPLDRQHVPNPSNLIETFLAMMVRRVIFFDASTNVILSFS